AVSCTAAKRSWSKRSIRMPGSMAAWDPPCSSPSPQAMHVSRTKHATMLFPKPGPILPLAIIQKVRKPMKKVYVAILALLFSAPGLFAQSDNTVRLGIKLAPNLAWVRSDTKGLESDGTLIGYGFGLMAEFPFGTNGNYRFATGLFLNNIG